MQGSGISSAAIWTAFNNATTAFARVLKWALKIAWTRVEHVDAGFAVVGTSVVSGTDIVKGEGVTAVTSPDVFDYFDETDRLVGLEYTRVLNEPLGGISTAILDAVLDNSDFRFTPNYNATVGTAILPKRPINAHIGFEVEGQDKLITIFKGLTKMPQEDKGNHQIKVTAVDYVEYLSNIPMESAKYVDQRSDEIIEDILTTLGFGSTQYSLDTGLNTIGFAFFEKGVSAGDRIKLICEAEEGVFYQDENGVMRFENKNHSDNAPYDAPIWDIDPEDIISWDIIESTRLINKVVVKAKPRTVRSTTDIWQDGEVRAITPLETITVWANFLEPVNDVIDPAATTDYLANGNAEGTGADMTADVSIVHTEFTTASKLEITNDNVSDTIYMTLLKLRGDPATWIDETVDPPVSNEILEVYEDANSINKFDEQELTITNDLIDDSDFAQTLAQHTVNRYKDPNRKLRLKIQGVPQLQLRDMVRVKDISLQGYTEPFIDNATLGVHTGGNTVTFNHVNTSVNGVLIVLVGIQDSNHANMPVEVCTYNGVSLTKIRSDEATGNNRTEVWYLVNPAQGTNQVVVTTHGNVGEIAPVAVTVSNIDQSDPVDDNDGSTGAARPMSDTINTTRPNSMILSIFNTEGDDIESIGDQRLLAERHDQSYENTSVGSKLAPVVGTHTLNWDTYNRAYSQSFAISMVSLNRYENIINEYKNYRVVEIQGEFLGGVFTQNLILREVKDIQYIIADFYSESNKNGSYYLDDTNTKASQSFTGNGRPLHNVKLYLAKQGSPTGNATAYIYAHTGTFGESGEPTGSPLATSETVDVSTLDTDFALVTFDFPSSERIILGNNTKYCVVIEYDNGDSSNYVKVGRDGAAPTHNGNAAVYDGSWNPSASYDLSFYVYEELYGG